VPEITYSPQEVEALAACAQGDADNEAKRLAASALGRAAAHIHQDEYPGDPVIGDWDSEAWSIDAADWFPHIEDDNGELWEAYRTALIKEVTRLTDCDVVF
jgi:hypothetical protein